MSFLELVKGRRSIRTYEKQDIKRGELELCVEAACYAPSACNSQPWKFIIVDNPFVKNLITKNIFSDLYSMNTFAKNAPAFIAIVEEGIKFPAWIGAKLKNTDFRKIDIGIACAHIILQAQELGIGTCILGWFDEKKLKKILSVPFYKKIALVIALGRFDQRILPEKHFKSRNETISYNKY